MEAQILQSAFPVQSALTSMRFEDKSKNYQLASALLCMTVIEAHRLSVVSLQLSSLYQVVWS